MELTVVAILWVTCLTANCLGDSKVSEEISSQPEQVLSAGLNSTGIQFVSTINKGNVTDLWADLDTWEAPLDMQKNFPYFLSGYDDEDRPIWIVEIGKYQLRKGIVEKGPETMAIFDKYVRQVQYRVRKSRTKINPLGKEINFLLDFDQLKLEQFADLQTMAYILKLATAYRGPLDNVIHVVVLVNTNYITETLINLVRPIFGRIFAKVEIYGTNRAKWLPRILQYFPKDQLPEWYGGYKRFQPIEVYG
ncbi:unnamed protein product [Allacma fusca]|uniref:CRAL-TRIO domain-containing protein n=1 Tax=Allacma fusca TaxID=39272 RepID=A0A8J2LD29_9HEXA|nr:unnamed protein product [Allacma fusca]